MFIFTLLLMAIAFAIASAINALCVSYAAKLGEAEYIDYKEIFTTIFYGYVILVVVVFLLLKLKMANEFFIIVAELGVVAWIIYQLIGKLQIKGRNNIIIFVAMSFVFNVIASAVLRIIFY